MNALSRSDTSIMKPLLLACALAAGICFASGLALAGECPPGQQVAGRPHPGGEAPHGVSDDVLATIDLSQESIAASDRLFASAAW